MTRAPETFTTSVPHGNVSPIRRPTKPETKKRAMPPKNPPSRARAPGSRFMATDFHSGGERGGHRRRSCRIRAKGGFVFAVTDHGHLFQADPAAFGGCRQDRKEGIDLGLG